MGAARLAIGTQRTPDSNASLGYPPADDEVREGMDEIIDVAYVRLSANSGAKADIA